MRIISKYIHGRKLGSVPSVREVTEKGNVMEALWNVKKHEG